LRTPVFQGADVVAHLERQVASSAAVAANAVILLTPD
jgi:hypothetical protein